MNVQFGGDMAMGWANSLCSCLCACLRVVVCMVFGLWPAEIVMCSVLNRSFESIVELIVEASVEAVV